MTKTTPARLVLLLFLLLALSKVQGQNLNLGECNKEENKNVIFGAECGYIRLPENHQNANSKQLDIYMMRLPAIRSSDKPPIFFIAGGPGQASTALAPIMRHRFSKLLIERDFIFVDQRGTGKSSALECDSNELEYINLSFEEVQTISIAQQEKCLAKYTVDLTRFSTPYAVNDLDEVRQALNYDKIFLWGGSYGTRVALEYLRTRPQVLAGAILDGVAPINLQLPANSENDASRSLERIFATCERRTACQQALPDLKQRWLTLLASLMQQAQTVELKHPRTEALESVYIDDATLSAWVRLALYSREAIPILPYAIDQATEGDYSKLFSLVAISFDSFPELSEGLFSTVVCAEDYQYGARKGNNVSQAGDTLIRLPMARQMDKLCKIYPKGDVPSDYFKGFRTAVPTLFLSGEFDPVTPPKWAESIERQFENQQHIIVSGGHHIVSGLGCIPGLISDFVQNPSRIDELETDCVNFIKPIRFFIDGAGPHLTQAIDEGAAE